MSRVRALVATLLAALCVASGAPALSSADSTGDVYRHYALIREQLVSCSLDRTWHHLSATARSKCTSLRNLYILWSEPGESYRYHVHCRTSKKCPAPPEGEPDPRSPIPSDAHTFR